MLPNLADLQISAKIEWLFGFASSNSTNYNACSFNVIWTCYLYAGMTTKWANVEWLNIADNRINQTWRFTKSFFVLSVVCYVQSLDRSPLRDHAYLAQDNGGQCHIHARLNPRRNIHRFEVKCHSCRSDSYWTGYQYVLKETWKLGVATTKSKQAILVEQIVARSHKIASTGDIPL